MNAYLQQTKPTVCTPPIDVENLKKASLEEVFQTCTDYLITEFRLLRDNVAAQEFLKADMLNTMGSSNSIAVEKEKMLQKMINELAKLIGTKDGAAFSTLVISGLTLLTFSGQQQKVLFGIDLKTDEGWAGIETALANIFRGAYLYTKERQAAELLLL